MKDNPTLKIQECGQSLWYDNLNRELIVSGELQRLIDEYGIVGITSNPTIFERAVSGSPDYDVSLQDLLKKEPHGSIERLYEKLVIRDIQSAADMLHPVYDNTKFKDGYVSIEVSPDLAYDREGTIAEAKRLFAEINRPNIMIKVPATKEGMEAVQILIAEGININVTLMFSVQDYLDAAEAYLSGLEKLDQAGGDLTKVTSVASFFVSRIDTAVDNLLPKDAALLGKIAVANAKIAYSQFQNPLSQSIA